MPRRSKILIVDDDPITLTLATAALSDLNCSIACAPNGRAALAMVQIKTFDLILLDIMMPRTDGYETLKVLRNCDYKKSIPVIAMSTLSDDQVVAKAIASGAQRFVSKPLVWHKLVGEVRHLLKCDDECLERCA